MSLADLAFGVDAGGGVVRTRPEVHRFGVNRVGNASTGHGNRYVAQVRGEAAVRAARADTFLGEGPRSTNGVSSSERNAQIMTRMERPTPRSLAPCRGGGRCADICGGD
jgi:hypothetical protein